VPLGQVRSNLGIIAQDPILLSGTLRHNLDLEGKYDDQALYDALRQVQLITSVDDPGSSSSSISDSGTTVVEPATPGGGVAPNNVFTNLDSEIKSGGEK
jgi:ABC-type multidrug transport system fused ATPase/permease subunit